VTQKRLKITALAYSLIFTAAFPVGKVAG